MRSLPPGLLIKRQRLLPGDRFRQGADFTIYNVVDRTAQLITVTVESGSTAPDPKAIDVVTGLAYADHSGKVLIPDLVFDETIVLISKP